MISVKLAIRHLFKEKLYSLVCVLGLALAFSTSYFTLSFIQHEYNNDHHFASKERTYQLKSNPIHDTKVSFNSLPISNADYLAENFPEVEVAVPIYQEDGDIEVKVEDKVLMESHWAYTNARLPDLFEPSLFQLKLPFAPGKVLICHSLASKLYNSTDLAGETITIGNESYVIAGTFRDFPTNSQVDVGLFICPLPSEEIKYAQGRVFVRLKPFTDITALNIKIDDMSDQMERFMNTIRYHLVSIHDVYHGIAFSDNISRFANPEMIYLMSAISLIILFVATFNIVNLSQVQAIYRSKEVGVKKILGISRGRLFHQFLTEALIIVAVGWLLAITIVQLLRDYYTAYLSTALYHYTSSIVLLVLLSLAIVGLMAAVQYMLFSKANPRQIAGGTYKVGEKKWVFNTLIGAQFVITAALIGGTLLVDKQLDYIISKPLGFNIENLWCIKAGSTKVDLRLLKPRLDALPQIEATTLSTGLPFMGHGGMIDDSNGKITFVPFIEVDKDFFNTFQIPFAELPIGDMGHGTIINQRAKADTDLDVEKLAASKVIGVVHDFHMSSLLSPIGPLVMKIGDSEGAFLTVRINSTDHKESLTSIKEQYEALFPNRPLEIVSLKDKYLDAHASALQLSVVMKVLSLIAIFIACIGLASMTGFFVRKRLKEIAIRKVLGASLIQILYKINSSFIVIISITVFVASAIVYHYGTQWLANFSYAVTTDTFIFVYPALIVFTIAIFILVGQSWRTANSNPIDALRSE